MSSNQEQDKQPVLMHDTISMTKHEAPVCGGHSQWQQANANDKIQDIANKVRSDVENKHGKGSEYTVEQFTTQVVAGTNYKMKIRLDPGRVVEVQVHQSLPHTGKGPELMY